MDLAGKEENEDRGSRQGTGEKCSIQGMSDPERVQSYSVKGSELQTQGGRG